MDAREQIKQNYDEKAEVSKDKLERESTRSYELKAFNNWIKAVLIQTQTKAMCKTVEKVLDLKKGDSPLLHVLDIGCGRGQDIAKWRLARVAYMVALDFSPECIKAYQQRWKQARNPYRLYTVTGDFTSKSLYSEIEHSFYDVVSAQFCFHYMFGTEQGLQVGLASILSNLLIGGVFMATIPDSYTILKKINEKGKIQSDGSKVYGNKYFSIKFETTEFNQPINNIYGFYLEDAVGKKHENGEIEYTNQWLVELDSLSKILEKFGVEIEQTMNFLEYYVKYRDDYKELFPKFKLIFGPGESMDPELWEIAHLYRVLICRKKSKGRTIKDFNLKKRQQSIVKECHGYFHHQSYNSGRFNNQRGGHRDRGSFSGHHGSNREEYSRSRDHRDHNRQQNHSSSRDFKRQNNY